MVKRGKHKNVRHSLFFKPAGFARSTAFINAPIFSRKDSSLQLTCEYYYKHIRTTHVTHLLPFVKKSITIGREQDSTFPTPACKIDLLSILNSRRPCLSSFNCPEISLVRVPSCKTTYQYNQTEVKYNPKTLYTSKCI